VTAGKLGDERLGLADDKVQDIIHCIASTTRVDIGYNSHSHLLLARTARANYLSESKPKHWLGGLTVQDRKASPSPSTGTKAEKRQGWMIDDSKID
jgi:hypothetical protein